MVILYSHVPQHKMTVLIQEKRKAEDLEIDSISSAQANVQSALE